MRKGSKGDPSRFIGIRWKETIAVRFDAVRAKLGQNLGFQPDLSDVVRSCALEGLAATEAKLGIAAPPTAPAVEAKAAPQKRKRAAGRAK